MNVGIYDDRLAAFPAAAKAMAPEALVRAHLIGCCWACTAGTWAYRAGSPTGRSLGYAGGVLLAVLAVKGWLPSLNAGAELYAERRAQERLTRKGRR